MKQLTELKSAFRDLFDREWYTNHGPLAREFESALGALLGTRHAVCVTNPAIGLVMALESLRLSQPVVAMGEGSSYTKSALYWSRSKIISFKSLSPDIWPGAVLCDGAEINLLENAKKLSEASLCPLIIDCTCNSSVADILVLQKWLPRISEQLLGRLMIVLSFGHHQAISAQGAACIATSNDELAEVLRNIRSSYGVRETVQVVKTANGRMSEAQALCGLVSMKSLSLNPS